jgi:hypothetical protein
LRGRGGLAVIHRLSPWSPGWGGRALGLGGFLKLYSKYILWAGAGNNMSLVSIKYLMVWNPPDFRSTNSGIVCSPNTYRNPMTIIGLIPWVLSSPQICNIHHVL